MRRLVHYPTDSGELHINRSTKLMTENRTSPKDFCKDLLRIASAASVPLLVAGWILATAAPAQEPAPRSTWDGIYSDAQALRGAAQYRQFCQSCHGDTLDGLGPIPPLAGSDFTSHWDGMPLAELFDKMQTSMPADRPGQVSPRTNVDILAYILQYNKFPAGSSELSADAASLKTIRFTAERSKK